MNNILNKQSVPNHASLVIAIVLNWNGFEDTRKCIESLQASEYSNLQIIIVDNASTDGSQDKLQKLFPELHLILNSFNKGYAGGNNVGINLAMERRAKYILVINNDIVVEKDSITLLVKVAEKDNNVGVVTGLIKYQSNPYDIYYAAGKYSRWRCAGLNVVKKNSFNPTPVNISFVNGSYFLVRKEALEKLGLLDESYFMYFEDLVFSNRISKHYKLIYISKY